MKFVFDDYSDKSTVAVGLKTIMFTSDAFVSEFEIWERLQYFFERHEDFHKEISKQFKIEYEVAQEENEKFFAGNEFTYLELGWHTKLCRNLNDDSTTKFLIQIIR